MKTLPIGPFLGINNRLPDFALHVHDKGDYVRTADNVDLTNAGTFIRRQDATLVQAMSGAHSLHGDYLVRDSVLYKVTLPTYSETLVRVLSSNNPMSYVEFNGDLYFANGTDFGRISNGTAYPLALPTPASPNVATIPGSLSAGWYQVATQYINQDTGEEGGASPSSNYELAANSALRVTLPAATTGATHVRVYVSTVNGSIPLLQTTVTASTASVDITAITIGREANQRYEAPLPAGKLFLFNGCLCSYKDGNVYEGLPFRPGYYLPVEGRIPFPATVTNVVPAQNGVFVVADKTYWIQGPRMTTSEMIQDVLPYGGVAGTEFSSPNKSLYGWFSHKGIVLGTPQGEVQAVMSDNLDVVVPESGFSTLFEDGGYRRVVSCGYCLNLDNLGATTYSGWDFTSISGNYGTKADGIYQLGGGLADATVYLGSIDFGAENIKHMPAVYLSYSSAEKLNIRIATPSNDEFEYAARACSDDIKMHRVDTGRGLRANWFGMTITNTDGADFALASVSFAPIASQRRI